MWEGLIILGLAALGSLTAITIKALEFARFVEDEKEGLEEGAVFLDERAEKEEKSNYHRLAERDRSAATELRRRAAKLCES